MMNLYLVTRNDESGLDEYDSAVIAAPNERIARNFIESEESSWTSFDGYEYSPLDITIKLIGRAEPDIQTGVLLATYHTI